MVAGFRRGAEAIQAAATRTGGGSFTPTHRFEAGETKYLQFLTPIEDVFTVLMHRFVITGYREDGNTPIYKDFISRRDEALDGPEGYDPLIDRFGLNPSQRSIAVAVELEPVWKKQGTKKVIDDWKIVEREYTDAEGTEHVVPNIALVVESPFTFFGHLTAFADVKPIESVIFAVVRTGKSTDTTYTLIEADKALEGADELYEEFSEQFDLEAYLDELADEDRMHELIDPLDDDFTVSRYQKKDKKKNSSSASSSSKKSSSTRSRRSTVRDEEPEESPESDDPENEEGEEDATDRKRSFAALRRTTGK